MSKLQPATNDGKISALSDNWEKFNVEVHGCSIAMMFPKKGNEALKSSAAEILISMFEQQAIARDNP
jgi:hypothetical protein